MGRSPTGCPQADRPRRTARCLRAGTHSRRCGGGLTRDHEPETRSRSPHIQGRAQRRRERPTASGARRAAQRQCDEDAGAVGTAETLTVGTAPGPPQSQPHPATATARPASLHSWPAVSTATPGGCRTGSALGLRGRDVAGQRRGTPAVRRQPATGRWSPTWIPAAARRVARSTSALAADRPGAACASSWSPCSVGDRTRPARVEIRAERDLQPARRGSAFRQRPGTSRSVRHVRRWATSASMRAGWGGSLVGQVQVSDHPGQADQLPRHPATVAGHAEPGRSARCGAAGSAGCAGCRARGRTRRSRSPGPRR